MSRNEATFIDLSMSGKVMLDEIDDYVDAWHDDPAGVELPDYLGMTFEEYALWAVSPDTLAYIITARKFHTNLADVVNDNFVHYRLAARASDSEKVRQLERWLKSKGREPNAP